MGAATTRLLLLPQREEQRASNRRARGRLDGRAVVEAENERQQNQCNGHGDVRVAVEEGGMTRTIPVDHAVPTATALHNSRDA